MEQFTLPTAFLDPTVVSNSEQLVMPVDMPKRSFLRWVNVVLAVFRHDHRNAIQINWPHAVTLFL